MMFLTSGRFLRIGRFLSIEVKKRPHSRVLYDPKFTDGERKMADMMERESGYDTTRRALEEAWTIDPVVYTSEIFAKIEEKSVFSRAWTCVGLVDKVRQPGDTIKATLGESPIFVTRDKKGNLNGFHNVCRHRGSLLVLEDGRYPVISCPYHRWGYSLDGRLLATPMWDMGPDGKTKNKSARKKKREENKKKLEELLSFADIQKVEDDAEKFQNCEQMNAITKVFTPQGDFDKKDYPLFKVRVETWGPYVFATKDENAPRIDEYLGDMVEHLGDHPLDELVVVREKTFKPEANWKLLMENFMEYYHLPAVHPELCLVSGVEEHSRMQGRGMNVGFITYPMTRGGTPIDPGILPAMPGLSGRNLETAWFHALFPNTFYFLMPDHIFLVILSPEGPKRTIEKSALLVHPSILESGKVENIDEKLDAMMAFYDKTNVEDLVACERVQKGVASGMYEGGRFSYKYEETIHRFQNMLIDYVTGEPRIPNGDELGGIGRSWHRTTNTTTNDNGGSSSSSSSSTTSATM